MTPIQKSVCRSLLKSAYSSGFDSMYPLAPIAAELGATVESFYDDNTETGELYAIGSEGEGLIHVRNGYASVNLDMRELVEHWSDFHPYL